MWQQFRLHEDPKPLVVGIAWVVECVEKRTRVDESKFLINLDLVNVAGTTKVTIHPSYTFRSLTVVIPSVENLCYPSI